MTVCYRDWNGGTQAQLKGKTNSTTVFPILFSRMQLWRSDSYDDFIFTFQFADDGVAYYSSETYEHGAASPLSHSYKASAWGKHLPYYRKSHVPSS